MFIGRLLYFLTEFGSCVGTIGYHTLIRCRNLAKVSWLATFFPAGQAKRKPLPCGTIRYQRRQREAEWLGHRCQNAARKAATKPRCASAFLRRPLRRS